MGHQCSSFCRPSVTVNGRRYRVVKDLGEGGKNIFDLLARTEELFDGSVAKICNTRVEIELL